MDFFFLKGERLRSYDVYNAGVATHFVSSDKVSHTLYNRDLKQARTATAVNKQLNCIVKNKSHTTNYIYCIFEAYFMIKSVWKNCIYWLFWSHSWVTFTNTSRRLQSCWKRENPNFHVLMTTATFSAVKGVT